MKTVTKGTINDSLNQLRRRCDLKLGNNDWMK